MEMIEVDATLLHAGKLRYANNSNYKNDVMIRKEVILHLFFCYIIFLSLMCVAVS